MSTFVLKLIAVISMLIDHTGAVLFPEEVWFRIVGRLAFPIFCFLIAEGYTHTRNVKRYAFRLFLFALLSEIPFDLLFFDSWFDISGQNVFFTLFLGLCAVWVADILKSRWLVPAFLCAGLFAAAAQLLCTDYGAFGVALIVAFFLCRDKDFLKTAAFLLLNTGDALLNDSMVQLYAAPAVLPILLYNGKPGKYRLKVFFYLFYPCHLLILYFVSRPL